MSNILIDLIWCYEKRFIRAPAFDEVVEPVEVSGLFSILSDTCDFLYGLELRSKVYEQDN